MKKDDWLLIAALLLLLWLLLRRKSGTSVTSQIGYDVPPASYPGTPLEWAALSYQEKGYWWAMEDGSWPYREIV